MRDSKSQTQLSDRPLDAAPEGRGAATRNRLLDAAERVVARGGVKGLTFDNVALEANAAKGTVLYHFESKDALSSAMLARFITRFDMAWGDAIASDPISRGRAVRAYVTATFGDLALGEPPLTGADFDPVNGALTAALAETPERLAPVREQGQRHQAAITTDGLDPVMATIIRLAVDGLWFAESFGLMNYDPELKAAALNRLKEWTKTPPEN